MPMPRKRPPILRKAILFRVTASGLVALAGLMTSVRGSAATQMQQSQAQAVIAMERLEGDFFNTRTGFYTVSKLAHGPIASVWPIGQVLAAAITVARITHTPADLGRVYRIIHSLTAYRGPGGVYHTRTYPSRRYSDDNNWIALDLLDAYDLTHDRTLLAPVMRIFAFAVASWDTRHGGGVLWADNRADRPTVSTAPAITIGLRLAAITHQSYYRTWADRFYAWENSHMRRGDGLYWDHIEPDGTIDTDIVSYNQGVMIDANLRYAQVTHQARYIDEAQRIARAAEVALPGPWRSRGMYTDFDAIYLWSLIRLNEARPNSVGLQAAREYLHWAWPIASTPRTKPHRTEYDLLEQAGFVMEAAAFDR